MTDPHQPFQRPHPGQSRSGDDTATDVNDVSTPPSGVTDPMILDPEFHQSVWKPWDEPAAAGPDTLESGENEPPAKAGIRRRVAPRTIVTLAAAVAVALVVALLIHPLQHTPTWPYVYLVEDMARTPTIAWSADASDTYCAELDPDHAIMAGPGRVWSLDLRNGRNRWSVDIPEGQSGVTCLTGANLVAVQVGASFSTEVKSTLLLDGATGRTVAELPGDEIVQVIPLGKIIGLVDRSNTLRAVAPDKLDDPLWTRSLPVRPNENLSYIHVEQIDALSIQLWYSSGQNVAGGEQTYTPVLSLEDGKDPAWAQKSWSDTTMYQRVGDVVLFYRLVGNDFEASVLDLEGRELWRFDDAEPTVSGSRLYGLSPGTRNEGTENMHELRELDPRSGEPIGTHVFTGEFDYAVAAPQDRLAVFQTGSLTILDEDLQALPTVRGVDYGGTYLGKKLLYTGGNMYQESNARRTRLTAVDPSTARTVWVFYVDPGQRIAQMGRHLVVMDNGGKTIHGLRAGSGNG